MERVTIFAAQGNVIVNTAGQLSVTKVVGSFPSCTVSVFDTGTSNLTTIFADNASTPKSNPFTADSTGAAFFYAANGARVDVQFSGTGIGTPFTIGDILLSDPATQANSFIGTSFSSASTPIALTGVFRLASSDIGLSWRNNANSADLAFTKNSSDVLNWPGAMTIAGSLGLGANAITAGGFRGGNANSSLTGMIRLSSTDALKIRNNANSADLNLLSKNAADVAVLGDTAGVSIPGPINPGSTTVFGPITATSFGVVNGTTGAFSGALTAKTIEGVRSADQFASLQAAHDDLPAAGGSIFVPAGSTPFGAANATNLVISKPCYIKFDNAPFTYAGVGVAISCASQAGLFIEGSGSPDVNNPTKGTSISITGTAVGAFDLIGPSLIIKNLAVLGPGSGSGVGCLISGNGFYAENVQVKSFGSDGWQINGTRANTNSFVMKRCRSYSNGGVGFKTFGVDSNIGTWIGTDAQFNTGVQMSFSGGSFGHCFDNVHCQPSTDVTSVTFVASYANHGSIYIEPVNPFAANCITFDATSSFNDLFIVNGRLVGDSGLGNNWYFGASDFTPSGTGRRIWQTNTNNDTALNITNTVQRKQQTTETTNFGIWLKAASPLSGYMMDCQSGINLRYNSGGFSKSFSIWNGTVDANMPTTVPVFGLDSNGKCTGWEGNLVEGEGLTSVRKVTTQKSESAADTNVLTLIPPATAGTYRINFALALSAAAAAVLGWTATWKDPNGAAKAPTNLSLFQVGAAAPALTFTTSTATDEFYGSIVIDIDNSATAIVVKLTLGSGTFTGKASAVIERLA